VITNASAASIKGLDHLMNEDRYLILDGRVPIVASAGCGFLYGVMDGVGSAPHGMSAAQMVADRLGDFYADHGAERTGVALRELLFDVNYEIRDRWGVSPGTRQALGATVATVAWFAPDSRLRILHSGDTMAWRFDQTHLTRLVHEHSHRGLITSYLGMGESLQLDSNAVEFEEGDSLCLVSDGVTKALRDEDVAMILKRFPKPELAASELVKEARLRGSRDDITAIVVDLEEW